MLDIKDLRIFEFLSKFRKSLKTPQPQDVGFKDLGIFESLVDIFTFFDKLTASGCWILRI